MALLRFCSAGPKCFPRKFSGKAIASSAIVRNQNQVKNCVSSAVRLNVLNGQSGFSWLARVASVSASNQRDYHSGNQSRKDGLEQFFNQHRQASQAAPSTGAPLRDPLNTGFADPHAAFKSKTLIELIRAYVVYMICSSSYLVNNNMQVRRRGWVVEEHQSVGGLTVRPPAYRGIQMS